MSDGTNEVQPKFDTLAVHAGAAPDPDGYVLEIDGWDGGRIGVNETRTLPGFAIGHYLVELMDVAGNCSVADANPRKASVPQGGTATMRFDVDCP